MARIAGRNGQVYLAIASGGTAQPISGASTWTFNANTDQFDVTAFGDPNHVYVAGLPDASGDFSGFYDDATAQTYTGAIDGQPRKFYLYPNATITPGQYWYGTVLVDFKADGSVVGPVNMTATWKAASSITKIG
jgi:hypothetical protein